MKKGNTVMDIKEYFKKNWENILCFGASGLIVLIGVIAFLCFYTSK